MARGRAERVFQLDRRLRGVGVAEVGVGEEASGDLPRVDDAALPVLAEEVPPPLVGRLGLDGELLDASAARRRGKIALRIGEGLGGEGGGAERGEHRHRLARGLTVHRLREDRRGGFRIGKRDRHAVQGKRRDKAIPAMGQLDEARPPRGDGEQFAGFGVFEFGGPALWRLDAA